MQKIIPKKIHTFSLHSTRSFKTFHKNYPKHVHKLEIDCISGRFLEPNLTKKILINLIKLTKKSSKFGAIQDINLARYLNASDSQALYVIKRFHRVQSLGLMWDFCNMKTQKETRKWLRYTSRLQSLLFRQTHPIAGAETLISVGNLNLKLAKDLQRTKIIRIIHSVLPSKFRISGHYILNMNNYPPTIQEVSLDLSKCSLLTDSRKPMSQFISMQKFSFLTRLELMFPLETENALILLRSIPNPQSLKSLGLYLRNNSPKYDEQDLTPIFEFIVDCPELEKLGLRMTHLTNKLELLSQLSSQYKLKILNLWVYARTDKHLHDLGRMILNAVNLESLGLTVSFNSDNIYKKTFSEFYQGMSQLVRLKKLRLEFTSAQDVKLKPDYPDLVRCLGSLSQLEELSLDVLDMNLHLEFPRVLEGLARIAPQLKKFSMDFLGNYFYEKDELGLIDVLAKMKGLRELEICRFSFKQKNESLLKLKQVLEGLESLKKIKWTCFDVPKEGNEMLFDLLRSVLMKRGVEECKLLQNYELYPNEMKKKIWFDEILERNPELRVVEISVNIVSNNWYGYPFETCKYSDA